MGGGFAKLMIGVPLAGAASLFILHPAEVRAQSVFCPSGFNLVGGSCVTIGATAPGTFSGAALASQALTELSQTTTQGVTRNTVEAITERRAREEQRCAEGFSRVDGTCQPISKPVPAPVAARPPARAAAPAPSLAEVGKPKETKAKAAVARRRPHIAPPAPELVEAAPPPPPPSMLMPVPVHPAILPAPIEAGARYATWAQVYGDYENRSATGPGFLNCCFFNPAINNSLILDLHSRISTVGFLAGADVTARNLLFAGDGLIAGVMAGYVSSDINLNALTSSGNSGNRGGGSSRLHGNLAGPTAGLYVTYFNGGFSTDLAVRVDALTLDESFNDFLITTASSNIFVRAGGSVPLLNGTITGNLNYRFNFYPNFWIEPTVGAQYTNSSYGSNAANFGLADGNLVMVQGGARLGNTTLIDNRILMTTTLTGLAYDDVLVAGGFIPTAAFGAQNLLVQADQGFVRGRGILALNFDFGDGLASFVQGEVRGGAHLFGAGGKAGIRYQW